MIGVSYEKFLEKLAKSSDLDKEEIEKMVDAKQKKLSGLISLEGAVQIIASELGISFDNEKLKISELAPGMKKVNVVGKIISLSPVRAFERKSGNFPSDNSQEKNPGSLKGKVANFVVADETSNTRVVLWNEHHIDMIENEKIGIGSVVEILNASVRDNEIHLGSFSELKLSDESLLEVVIERAVKEKKIFDLKVSDNARVRAFIVQIFEPKFFNVCPECGKKVASENGGFVCGQHNRINPEKRALINLVIDDGTESIRSVLFQEAIDSLGLGSQLDSGLSLQRQNLAGKEMVFSGAIRMNNFFNEKEFIVNKADEVDIDELINALEKKQP